MEYFTAGHIISELKQLDVYIIQLSAVWNVEFGAQNQWFTLPI